MCANIDISAMLIAHIDIAHSDDHIQAMNTRCFDCRTCGFFTLFWMVLHTDCLCVAYGWLSTHSQPFSCM